MSLPGDEGVEVFHDALQSESEDEQEDFSAFNTPKGSYVNDNFLFDRSQEENSFRNPSPLSLPDSPNHDSAFNTPKGSYVNGDFLFDRSQEEDSFKTPSPLSLPDSPYHDDESHEQELSGTPQHPELEISPNQSGFFDVIEKSTPQEHSIAEGDLQQQQLQRQDSETAENDNSSRSSNNSSLNSLSDLEFSQRDSSLQATASSSPESSYDRAVSIQHNIDLSAFKDLSAFLMANESDTIIVQEEENLFQTPSPPSLSNSPYHDDESHEQEALGLGISPKQNEFFDVIEKSTPQEHSIAEGELQQQQLQRQDSETGENDNGSSSSNDRSLHSLPEMEFSLRDSSFQATASSSPDSLYDRAVSIQHNIGEGHVRGRRRGSPSSYGSMKQTDPRTNFNKSGSFFNKSKSRTGIDGLDETGLPESNEYGRIDDERDSLLTISSVEIPLGEKTSCEASPILYRRRWYILAIFSVVALLQGMSWATFGPITQSCKAVFNWSDSDIALQGLVGNIAYCTASWPICLMLERKGLRKTMVLSAFLITLGYCARCITLHPPYATWTITAGTIVNSFGAVFPYSGVTLLSSKWFPPHQRTTATSIATLMCVLGCALAFVIGPQFVPAPPKGQGDNILLTTDQYINNYSVVGAAKNGHYNVSTVSEEREAIGYLFYTEAGICGFFFLLVLIYFPSQPPTPPSKSAQEQRLDLKQGLKSLFRNRQFLLILLADSFSTGIYSTFGIVLDMDVNVLGVSQKTAGWFGFYGIVGACIGGIVCARLMDRFPGYLKSTLIFLMVISIGTLLWFALLEGKFISFNWPSIYITTIVPAIVNYCAIPLFYELACEASYPTCEGVTTLTIAFCLNLVACVFLVIFLIPNVGVMWMNYFLLASVVISAIILLATRVSYNRIVLDQEINVAPAIAPSPTSPLHLQSGSYRAIEASPTSSPLSEEESLKVPLLRSNS